MNKLLVEISHRAILLNESDYPFTEAQMQADWLGNPPALDNTIEKAQLRLQIKFPQDYIDFLKIADGFSQTTTTSMTFLPVEEVDYLIKLDEELVEIWNETDDLPEIGQALKKSILIGGRNEEQCFLLIPPSQTSNNWRYWKFASWIPGPEEFKNLKDYFKNELQFLRTETKGFRKQRKKFVIDYSLRDYVFDGNWKKAFETALQFIVNNKNYYYFKGEAELLSLMLLSASKLDNYKVFEKILHDFQTDNKRTFYFHSLLSQFEDAARNKAGLLPNKNYFKFINKEPSITLEEIELNIMKHRIELLKPKNFSLKVNYQLNFLFNYGDATTFINLYEPHVERVNDTSHLYAALVYSCLKEFEKVKFALIRHFDSAFFYRPFEAFLNPALSTIMDEDFTREILKRMQGKQ